jgi:hypothetical protein
VVVRLSSSYCSFATVVLSPTWRGGRKEIGVDAKPVVAKNKIDSERNACCIAIGVRTGWPRGLE